MSPGRTYRLAVALRDDHRNVAATRAAAALGWPQATVAVADLYLSDRPFSAGLYDLLVDPLLQDTWPDELCEQLGDGEHVVDVTLLPGVTDTAGEQLAHLVQSEQGEDGERGRGAVHTASGRRYRIGGVDGSEACDALVRAVLANPIIERWVAGAPAELAAPPVDGEAPIERVALRGLDPAQLAALDRERGLALDADQLAAIAAHFTAAGRDPTDAELETIAQTWSEHCAHTTFRASLTVEDTDGTSTAEPSLLDQLRDATEQLGAPWVCNAFAGNAGVVSFDGATTYALKAETHNHPSAVEPFGGANTGVGGVIRDILGAGHRPVAVTDVLCFGPPALADAPAGVLHPARIAEGVIAGVADYGNKIGLPTVAGAVLFDPGYTANPLVYAGCIGTGTIDRAEQGTPRRGDRIIVLGGRTGRDGIRGATFSSRTMDAETGSVAGASVQIGDPIVEKLLIDVLDELGGRYRAITDCGAGGFSSAIGELAEQVGAQVALDAAPLKYPGLAPWEIWLSEAQERMVLAVDPDGVAEVAAIAERHGVECTDLGSFGGPDGSARLVVGHRGRTVVDLDSRFLHDGRPPRHLRARRSPVPAPGSVPLDVEQLDTAATLLALLAHPNIASKAEVIHRYDHEIRGATRARALVGADDEGHGDGVVIADSEERSGIAVGIGVNPWYGQLDPQRMAQAAVDEAIRNVVAVGADPSRVALLDNFSWGDPRRAETLGALVDAVHGCVGASHRFRAPFVSGKDSLNNEYLGADGERHAVPPTLVITAVAAHPGDVPVAAALAAPGNVIAVAGGRETYLGGSHVALVHSCSHGEVAAPDEEAPARFAALHAEIRAGRVRACHDVSEGGLLVAVAELCIAGDLGATLGAASNREWFGERNATFVVELDPADVTTVRAALPELRIIGEVTSTRRLSIDGGPQLGLDELRGAWRTPLLPW